MKRPRSGTMVAVMIACAVTAVARAAEPGGGTARSAGDAMRQMVAALGYEPVVGDRFVAFSRSLPVDRWKAAIDSATRRGANVATTEVESRVIDELRRRLDAIIRQADGGSGYWNLPDVLADRRAQCLGNCQLWYVLGNAVGVRVAALEVSRPADGELGEHETHVATLIRLADGRVRMIDTRYGIDSGPFRFGEVYRRDETWWSRAELSAHRSLHRRVRVLDRSGIEAAILLNIGNTYRRAGHDAEAAPIYDRGLTLDPDSPALNLAVGETFVRAGTWDEAERSIRAAIAFDPECSDAYAALGTLLTRQNKWAEATAALQRAVALKPHSPDAIQRLREAERRLAEAGHAVQTP